MKKASFLGLLFTAMSTAFVACSDEEPFQSGDGTGRLAIRLDVNTSAITSRPETRAIVNGDTLKADDLYLKSTAIDGSNWEKDWGKVSDFNENYADSGLVVTVPRGKHLVEAYFGNDSVEGIGKPYIYGSQEVVIDGGRTEVGIVAELQSAIFSFNFDESLKDMLNDYNIEVVTAKGNQIEYTAADGKDAARAYVMPGQTAIYFQTQTKSRADGSEAPAGAVKVGDIDAQKRHHYIVSLSASPESTPGKPMLQVTFDDSFQLADEITIDLSDDALTIQPEVVTAGFNSDNMVTVVSGSAPDALDFNIIAMSGIDQVTIETQNWSGILDYWADKIDLVGDDASKYANSGLETKGLGANRDKMAIVRMSGLLKNAMKATPEGQELIFTVTATSKDIVSEPVTLKVKVVNQTVVLSEVAGATLHRGNNAGYQLMLEYNGNNPAEDLILQYHAGNGWTDIADVTYTPSSEEGKYTAQFDMNVIGLYDSTLSQCEFRFRKNRVTTVEIGNTLIVKDILPSESAIPVAYDVYATRAYISVKEFYEGEINEQTQEDYTSKAKLFILSTDGTSYNEITEKENGYFKITGLTDNKKYTLKASLTDNITNAPAITFTTEAATQLPNGGFDNWTAEKLGDYQYLWKIGDGTPWATLNELTTSTSGSGSGSAAITGGCSYKATSGTIPANSRSTQSVANGGKVGTDKHGDGHTQGNATLHEDKGKNGTNAALIRTVGWGKNNTAAANANILSSTKDNGGFATCENITPGELFLGTYNNGADYSGYILESRPLKLSFYYHYDVVTSGNGDYATVEVKVLDSNNNVLAYALEKLSEESNYTLASVPLTYSTPTKAAKISIIFKSSGNSAALEKDMKFWRTPGQNNTSGGEYIGSELYIDDIELIY